MSIKIDKESFKTYLSVCPKIAWIFSSKENLWKTKEFIKNENIVIHYVSYEELDEDVDTTKFSFLDVYNKFFKDKELTPNNEILSLIEEYDKEIGIESLVPSNETVEDGQQVLIAAFEYYKALLVEYNQKNNSNKSFFDLSDFSFENNVEKTKELLTNDNFLYIFKPAFKFGEKLYTKCDVLINKGKNRFDIVEFKASTNSKLEHFYDVLYQKYLLEKNGYFVDDIFIGLINPEYIKGLSTDYKQVVTDIFEQYKDNCPNYEKDIKPNLNNYFIKHNKYESDIEYNELFKIVNYLEQSKSCPLFSDLIKAFLGVDYLLEMDKIFEGMERDFKNETFLLNDIHYKPKFNYKKLTCRTSSEVCHHVVNYYDVNQYTIYDFSRFKKNAAILYNEFYEEVDINRIDNPLDEYYYINEKPVFKEDQARLITVIKDYVKNDKKFSNYIVNRNKLKDIEKLLNEYTKTPVYMYDFETSKWAIPKYDRSWSYQQIPFQYSIHTILSEDFDFKTMKNIKHKNFIADKQEDPRIEFLNNFIKDCFEYGPGVYVAYNKSFEKTVLKNAIMMFPEVAYPLKYIYCNTIDLMEFFKMKENNWLIYHPDFKGSYSIKKTQPVLVPDLSYKDLIINKGDRASKIFRQYLDNIISQDEYEKIIRPDMLKYCDRDTLAMVALLQAIKELVKTYCIYENGVLTWKK
ncbi:hypothetical protein SCORR_v1c07250 [Spiroplasma corruscae]|uniref:DUF2779 domain-containing protein n=1 Tax=Spiroplasma corruscae TaxID=216934 RepID=A0A222EPP9_9MOLU|nr:DUF2779 domain-containing protein [Spiroplasma corruscae]ASP28497.1 hypothetical protein SCORR_v1c07250 [Spiroplasma corruscae]